MNEGLYLYQFHEFLKPSIENIISKIGPPKTVVELGVYQGFFTFNMTHSTVQAVPEYKHYAIDPFEDSADLPKDMIEQAYDCFMHNMRVSPYSHHIKLIRKKSWDGMIDLWNEGIRADLIYVDGDHRASGVLEDMVMGYKLLKVGGAMLCDDSVTWCHTEKNGLKPGDYSPRIAVDSFIHCNWNKIEPLILPNGYQSAFIKRSE